MSFSVDGETVSTVRVGVAITVEEFELKTSPGFTTWAPVTQASKVVGWISYSVL